MEPSFSEHCRKSFLFRNLQNILADECVSRILCAATAQRGDHSSRSRIAPGLKQPTRGSQRFIFENETHPGRASPPLLFGLAPRGVFRAPGITTGTVGSYPTFSPLPNALDQNRRVPGFSEDLPPRCKLTGGLFSVALSVAAPKACLRALRKATPWRYQARCPAVADSRYITSSPRLESGLSSRSPFIRRSGFRGAGDHPTHPPQSVYRCQVPGVRSRVLMATTCKIPPSTLR